MFNPRFPHTLRVWRSLKDEYGNPLTDDQGEALLEVVSLEKVVTIDGRPQMASEGAFETEPTEWIEFGYRTQSRSTKDTTDVMVSDYALACPMFTTPLESGYKVEIKDYDRTYWGVVVKKQTFNLGSNIWINEVKN